MGLLISFKAQAQVAPQATFKYHVENNSFNSLTLFFEETGDCLLLTKSSAEYSFNIKHNDEDINSCANLSINNAEKSVTITKEEILAAVDGDYMNSFINIANKARQELGINTELQNSEIKVAAYNGTTPDKDMTITAMGLLAFATGYTPDNTKLVTNFEDAEQMWMNLYDNIVIGLTLGIALQPVIISAATRISNMMNNAVDKAGQILRTQLDWLKNGFQNLQNVTANQNYQAAYAGANKYTVSQFAKNAAERYGNGLAAKFPSKMSKAAINLFNTNSMDEFDAGIKDLSHNQVFLLMKQLFRSLIRMDAEQIKSDEKVIRKQFELICNKLGLIFSHSDYKIDQMDDWLKWQEINLQQVSVKSEVIKFLNRAKLNSLYDKFFENGQSLYDITNYTQK